MDTARTQVTLPAKLLREIDSLVGKKGRSAFFTEVAIEALRARHSNGNATLASEDEKDIAAARKSLRSRTRIPWSAVKAKRRTG
jgi:metal-responsive CopG/Arc/MetJ family transcriptional regulator